MFGPMPRLIAVAGLLAVVAGCGATTDTARTDGFGASMPTVVRPPGTVFTRTMFASASIATVDMQIDKCGGPVSVPLGGNRPILVAEHDFCGGSGWISRLNRGQAVDLSGPGIGSGIYVVAELKVVPRGGKAKISDLPKQDVVLQTCISKTEMVLVGLNRFSPLRMG